MTGSSLAVSVLGQLTLDVTPTITDCWMRYLPRIFVQEARSFGVACPCNLWTPILHMIFNRTFNKYFPLALVYKVLNKSCVVWLARGVCKDCRDRRGRSSTSALDGERRFRSSLLSPFRGTEQSVVRCIIEMRVVGPCQDAGEGFGFQEESGLYSSGVLTASWEFHLPHGLHMLRQVSSSTCGSQVGMRSHRFRRISIPALVATENVVDSSLSKQQCRMQTDSSHFRASVLHEDCLS